ncbi:RING/U-box superfamily protein [Actinidia rufa]|uniref:RING-type E3 ubiquitin transferase n=1 Tax=Actinidia rufa TaxID=165716 RepID=A0A7J0FEY1_9ERIC|nr:RING/U-box superfamily protein [Actinidia rufa]
MGDSSEMSGPAADSATIELSGKIVVLGIALLLFVTIFLLFLHLYAKWFWYRREEEEFAAAAAAANSRRRRRRFDFAPGHIETLSAAGSIRRGLDPSVLKSLPELMFNPKDLEDGLECAVCLSELAAGEKVRLLPKCNHGFHVDCIDMWFQSHSTCPICRNPVSTQSSSAHELTLESIIQSPRTENSAAESLNFPTNVLFWGNQTQVSTLGPCLEEDRQLGPNSSQLACSSSSSPSTSNRQDGVLVIDIPRQVGEDEEPKSPPTTRMRSLKRLLSRDRRVNTCSPSVDPEQASRNQS